MFLLVLQWTQLCCFWSAVRGWHRVLLMALPFQEFKLSDWGKNDCKSLQVGYGRSPISKTTHLSSVWAVAMVWKSSMTRSINYPFPNLINIQRPESELPGVAGVSAKRLAANIGEGAMSPRRIGATEWARQLKCCLLSQCSHDWNWCVNSEFLVLVLSSAPHWSCKNALAKLKIGDLQKLVNS